MTVGSEWRRALREVLDEGLEVTPSSPGGEWRGRANRELMAYKTKVPMARSVVTSGLRDLGRRFLVAEAAWILSGDNRLETIAPFARNIKRFSDDGLYFFGAYGPRFQDQRAYVLNTLRRDPQSRQAIIQVWREQPRQTNDTPCTLSWQFLLRAGELHCVATMRSSDLITGWPYDVFNFSMVAASILLDLRTLDPATWDQVSLGTLHLTAGSQHVYRLDAQLAGQVAAEDALSYPPEPRLLILSEFAGSAQLRDHLWRLARREPLTHSYLRDLFPET